jgi:putative ABC transport system permease protein
VIVSWLNRFRNQWRVRELDAEFDAELRFHLESRTDANLGRGMSPRQAEREARQHLGNVTRAREGMREARMVMWCDELVQDVRHGSRVLRRHTGLTALAVLTLSLGIGANAAIFSVIQAVWLRPLPFPGADRLVTVLDGRQGEPGLTSPTIPELLELRAASRTLDAVSFFDTRDFQVTGGSEPERVGGARIEPTLLSMLGARPALGRLFSDADGKSGAAVVVLSDGLWRRNFGADQSVIGRTLELNGTAHEIVGVLPADFSLSYLAPPVDLCVPYPMSPAYTSRSGEFANVRRVYGLARTAPASSHERSEGELGTIAAAMAARHPDLYAARSTGAERPFVMTLEPVRESLSRGSRPVLLMLWGAVLLLLLTACVNTAQFLLAQALERESEVALRCALGAGRWRLIRQFASETLLLTGVAGVVAVAQAVWLTQVLKTLIPASMRVVGGVGVDGGVLLFMLAITVCTSLGCALVPSLRLSRAHLAKSLETRGAGASRVSTRQWFIAAEVAMSVVLLVAAGLLIRSVRELQRMQGGFSSADISVLRIRGIGGGGSVLGDKYARYLERIVALPGIDAAAVASSVLPVRPATRFRFPEQVDDAATEARQQASYQIVSGGYFATLGIPLEAGRLFTDDDARGRPPVAIVNRDLADRFWPGVSPVGRQIRAGEGPREATMTVIGLVGNVRPPFQVGDAPQLYVSYRQQSEPSMALVVRTRHGATLPLGPIKQAIWSVDKQQAVFGVTAMADMLAQATVDQRAMATLLGGFALVALLISISGVYTVITYVASRRIKEIAVRRVVGATGRDVLRSLAGPTVRWSVGGLILGSIGAISGSEALRASVEGVLPLDATLLVMVGSLYLAVVMLAIAAAARGALRVEPVTALRTE